MRVAAIVSLLSLVLLSTAALADVSGLMNYQGTLTYGDGVALDTTISMTFSIYTDSTGGTQVWTETQAAVVVSNGLFNVLLGSVNAISDTVFSDPVRWLGVQVGGDPELTPRQRIAVVGYAFQAAEADTADYARNGGGGDDGDWTISGNDIYSALPGNVGIGTATPSTKLDVRGTLNVGVNGAGYDVNFYGLVAGSRLLWDQSKMALRAGQDSDGTHWHPDSIGYHSFATGYNTKASTDWTTAMGVSTTANAFAAAAMGGYSTASGLYSTALGRSTTASGNYSTAMGYNTAANGLYSTAMGRESIAGGYASTAIGQTTDASGGYSTAMGYHTTSSGDYSIAMGRFATVDADNAIVLGKGISSISRLMNSVDNSLVVGFDDTTATLFVGGLNHWVGIGTKAPAAKLDVQGTLNVGIDNTGYDVNFYGANSGGRFLWDEDKMALRAGRDSDGTHWASDSTGSYSLATGYNTKASGPYSTAMGINTAASGDFSTAMGVGTTASGNRSTAMGDGTIASAAYSTAMGDETEASADRATAMGYQTIASGIVSIAMGEGTTASGERSIAMGGYTEASGDFSTAMGLYTTSSGDYSVAAGRYVTAQAADAIVLGHGLTSASRLVNNTSNSLMVGFNDTTATLFVGGASHRVGIGTTSPAYKLEVEGDVHVTQDISKAFTTGTSNLATPIAYAFINSGGAVVNGTPNVSSSWNGASSRYEITISGETYIYSSYVTQVTVSSGSRYTATTNSVSGNLLVYIYDTTGTKTQQAFQFVTYKP